LWSGIATLVGSKMVRNETADFLMTEEITVFVNGHSKKGVAEEAVGEVDVQRVLDVAIIGRIEDSKAMFWGKIKAKL
jgi:hypothetical protein